jgi:hypothetical protein
MTRGYGAPGKDRSRTPLLGAANGIWATITGGSQATGSARLAIEFG